MPFGQMRGSSLADSLKMRCCGCAPGCTQFKYAIREELIPSTKRGEMFASPLAAQRVQHLQPIEPTSHLGPERYGGDHNISGNFFASISQSGNAEIFQIPSLRFGNYSEGLGQPGPDAEEFARSGDVDANQRIAGQKAKP